MFPSRSLCCSFVLCLVTPLTGPVSRAADLVVDGDFESCRKGAELRRDEKGQDWYESRHDGDGRGLLKLSTRSVGGNDTRKAMIKGDADLNTYLSQRFPRNLTEEFTVHFDIAIREIFPDDNRSAFFFIGGINDKKGGPNSTGSERFVFLGFENSVEEGKLNLFAREGKSGWSDRTVVAANLPRERWLAIAVRVTPEDCIYEVRVEGATDWIALDCFKHKGKTPKTLTHLSFASWNDGAGTFYVDNVSVTTE
jgi:hypothetical protein